MPVMPSFSRTPCVRRRISHPYKIAGKITFFCADANLHLTPVTDASLLQHALRYSSTFWAPMVSMCSKYFMYRNVDYGSEAVVLDRK